MCVCMPDTRFKEDGVWHVSPTNRFYGSTMFAPQGKGMSKRGYTPDQEGDALCSSLSKNGCPDVCAYMPCNTGRRYTGVLFKCQRVCY